MVQRRTQGGAAVDHALLDYGVEHSLASGAVGPEEEVVDLVDGRLLLGDQRFELIDVELCLVVHGRWLRGGWLLLGCEEQVGEVAGEGAEDADADDDDQRADHPPLVGDGVAVAVADG